MTPYDYQVAIANKAYRILGEFGIVYLAMEERTGKTLTSLLIADKCRNVSEVLIVTKKKAIEGWKDTLDQFKHRKNLNFTLINFESLHKLEHKKFELAIVDEAHYGIAGYPRPSKTFLQLRNCTFNLPVILLSATPSAESYCQLFHQFSITKYSPFWQYKTFYNWHRDYGIPNSQYVNGRKIEQYNLCKVKEVVDATKHLFISYSRKELGFEHEPQDAPVYIELSNYTKSLICELKKDKWVSKYNYVADTTMKEMTALHQLEGGTLKLDEKHSVETGSTEKIDYIISKHDCHTTRLAIMYNYKAEEKLLRKHFPYATILQGTAFAEGIDLSQYDNLVIYSMNFSASKFIQRRARQCNLRRNKPIIVEYLLCKGFISELAYKSIVEEKMSFTQNYYIKHKKELQ